MHSLRKSFIGRRLSRALHNHHDERDNNTKALQAGNVKLCYACCTVAGTDGVEDKTNQDCWAVEVLRRDRDRDADPAVLFGVFDGHGEHGGMVAALAAEELPRFVQELHPQAKGADAALTGGFASTQQFLLQQPDLDCSLSGCTAVVALLVDDILVVANAGDSRCIAGRFEVGDEVVAMELSNEHTPCLMHEANRVLASGGRIAPLQFRGKHVGPPRVWERAADQPGLCITRSLGDTLAKRLGVTHHPEVASFPLTANDRYLALVSDGITEFMNSQEVIDMIHKWASAGTMPHEVARRLVREARARWKEQGGDGVIDDCTAVVVYMVYDPDEQEDEGEGGSEVVGGRRSRKSRRRPRHGAVGSAGPWLRDTATWLWSAMVHVLTGSIGREERRKLPYV